LAYRQANEIQDRKMKFKVGDLIIYTKLPSHYLLPEMGGEVIRIQQSHGTYQVQCGGVVRWCREKEIRLDIARIRENKLKLFLEDETNEIQ
jgi:hypothetical protein